MVMTRVQAEIRLASIPGTIRPSHNSQGCVHTPVLPAAGMRVFVTGQKPRSQKTTTPDKEITAKLWRDAPVDHFQCAVQGPTSCWASRTWSSARLDEEKMSSQFWRSDLGVTSHPH